MDWRSDPETQRVASSYWFSSRRRRRQFSSEASGFGLIVGITASFSRSVVKCGIEVESRGDYRAVPTWALHAGSGDDRFLGQDVATPRGDMG